MDNNQRISRLQSLGYNAGEASFLCVAALHSGFFQRRQYSTFSGKGPGYADVALGEKLLRLGHATVTALCHNRKLYHLCYKPFYAAMGETDNRNRRDREPQAIKRRLMMLDYVIAHPGFRFFPTEDEKVAFFTEERGIDGEHLPRKLYRSAAGGTTTMRHFVDKSPIFIDPTEDQNQSIVHFCFVDEGLHSTSSFEQYLQEYRPLFARLERLEVLYLACSPDQFYAAERLFARLFSSANRAPVDPLAMRIVEHFKVRDAYERRDMTGLNQAKIIQLRAERTEFSSSKYEALFARWKRDGDAAVIGVLCPESIAKPTQVVQFRTHLLPYTYELFGTPNRSNFHQGNTHGTRK
jgi:hypothetical protein